MKIQPGDTVAFKASVVKRSHDAASMRATVLSVTKDIATIDHKGTWLPHENGSNVRHIPLANLTHIGTIDFAGV